MHPNSPLTTAPGRLLPVAILLWLAGAYLRIPILVAPPLAPFIGQELGLSQTLSGALTTLPILMLALGAMPGSLAIARMGPRNTLILAMVIMVAGSAGRGLAPDSLVLLLTSALMGLGIAMMQPALPALLPRWLAPRHLALGSAIYMNGMLMGEFIGAGVTLPLLMPLLADSWRATLLAWSLPALLVAVALFLPRRDNCAPRRSSAWLPDWKNPLTLQIGLLLGVSSSLFFGLNAYMATLLEHQGQFERLADALFCFNLVQVFASLTMLKMARVWVGRRSLIVTATALCIAGSAGALVLPGWYAIASATVTSFFAGILLILLVALPPLLVPQEDTGRLSAGNFLVGYTLAFAIPMIGGALADVTGDSRHAVMVIIGYSLMVFPLTLRIRLKKPATADTDSFTGDAEPARPEPCTRDGSG